MIKDKLIQLFVDEPMKEKVRSYCEENGMGISTFIRMLIIEKFNKENY